MQWVTVTDKDGDRHDIRVDKIVEIGQLNDPKAKAYVRFDCGETQSVWVTQTVAEVRALIELSSGRE